MKLITTEEWTQAEYTREEKTEVTFKQHYLTDMEVLDFLTNHRRHLDLRCKRFTSINMKASFSLINIVSIGRPRTKDLSILIDHPESNYTLYDQEHYRQIIEELERQ